MRLIQRKIPPLPELTLKQFYEKRNRVLIIREVGGLGDILMHRMIFEDFKKVHPEFKIIFACPSQYHQALQNHPYIDEVLDNRKTSTYDYIVSYNTTTACTRYEIRVAPFASEHRSDIWAGHCGLKLTNHNMHINLSDVDKIAGIKRMEALRGSTRGPSVLISPISAMKGKDLTESHLRALINELRLKGCFVCAAHNFRVPLFDKLELPTFSNLSISAWMGIINATDYVISVDTATFHFAGGIKKPLMGIFTFADGKVYGKYYDFVLVQKHRDNGDWDCGPCYNWGNCPKKSSLIKPCLTEITNDMLIDGVHRMFERWPLDKIKTVQLVMESNK